MDSGNFATVQAVKPYDLVSTARDGEDTLMKHRSACSLLLTLIAATLCGSCSGESTPSAAETVTVTETVTATPTPSPSDTLDITPSPVADASDATGPSEGPQVLATSLSGKALALGDVFNAQGDWKEDRYDVVSRTGVRGLGVLVGCGGAEISLELRLARRFKGLTISVSQANNSPSSDGVIVAEIRGTDDKQLDTRRIAFDQTQDFAVDVTDTNAVTIALSMDRTTCTKSPQVIAVVENMVVTG